MDQSVMPEYIKIFTKSIEKNKESSRGLIHILFFSVAQTVAVSRLILESDSANGGH